MVLRKDVKGGYYGRISKEGYQGRISIKDIKEERKGRWTDGRKDGRTRTFVLEGSETVFFNSATS